MGRDIERQILCHNYYRHPRTGLEAISKLVLLEIPHMPAVKTTLTPALHLKFQILDHYRQATRNLERAMGIEPTSEAWEASILPLYDARSALRLLIIPK